MIAQFIGVAQYNGGIVSDKETSFLTDTSLANVANEVLGTLEGQLSRHKADDDDQKCSRLAKYTFYYTNICLMKTILLNIHCGLLRRNELNSTFEGVNRFLTGLMQSQDRKVSPYIFRMLAYLLYRLDYFQLSITRIALYYSHYFLFVGIRVMGSLL